LSSVWHEKQISKISQKHQAGEESVSLRAGGASNTNQHGNHRKDNSSIGWLTGAYSPNFDVSVDIAYAWPSQGLAPTYCYFDLLSNSSVLEGKLSMFCFFTLMFNVIRGIFT